jgi:antitoxin PrlF
MKEIIATVTSKGQVTVPVEIRRHLGLEKGKKIAFVVDEEGNVSLRPPTFPDIDSLRGVAGTLAQPKSWNEMKRIARYDRLVAKYGKRP